MSDWPGFEALFGALNSAATSGAQQQQAGADHFRKQQEGMLNAWSGGLTCPHPAMNAQIANFYPLPDDPLPYAMLAEARVLFPPDTTYRMWLATMALTSAFVLLLHYLRGI